MLSEIRLREHSSDGLVVPARALVLLIGPNNAGKSMALREIAACINKDAGERKIVLEVGYRKLSVAEVESLITPGVVVRLPQRLAVDEETINVPVGGNANQVLQFGRRGLREQFSDGSHDGGNFARAFMLIVDSAERQEMLRNATGDDLAKKRTPTATLVFDRERLGLINRYIHPHVRRYLVIDPSALGTAYPKLSATPGPELRDSLADNAIAEFAAMPELRAFSDGTRSFVGLVAALTHGDHRIFLVDEPEAYLHPPLQRSLGGIFADVCAEKPCTAVVATHSPDFLMGAVLSGRNVSVVRLEYEGGIGTSRLLRSDELTRLMRDPLLRSTGVLSALFHRGSIVCEADTDRAFYEEINHRLPTDRAARECSFLNAQNCQTVRRIIPVLRRMGVPAAAIVDLDAIGPQGQLTLLMRAASIPAEIVASLKLLQRSVLDSFGGSTDDEKAKTAQREGLAGLRGQARDVADAFVNQLKEYGVFLVPVGEVERWLPKLGVAGHGSKWLLDAFEKMGSDPTSDGYVKPEKGGVWEFLAEVAGWIADPKRRGIPADSCTTESD